jgi:hypothetical protein
VPRYFDYDTCHHRGDHFLRRPNFPSGGGGGSHTHLEPKHLNGPHFLRRGSRPTGSNGEVQRIMKTSSGRMVKCWIPKIYLTNPTIESLIFSHPM